MEQVVRIISVDNVTHDVKRFRMEKPEGYSFEPGQATEVAIDREEWRDEKRPFTFTGHRNDPYLEFTIKIYKDHNGVTNELGNLVAGDSLIIHDVWGAIAYGGEGYFIAGGAGITPFIAILRDLKAQGKAVGSKLFFSNKSAEDIILHDELVDILGKENIIFTLSAEKSAGYDHRYIDADFLKAEVSDFRKHFYICGPDKMIQDINSILIDLGATPDLVVFEK